MTNVESMKIFKERAIKNNKNKAILKKLLQKKLFENYLKTFARIESHCTLRLGLSSLIKNIS